MDDHFWPAMYPGIIVGFLVGLGGGNIISTILGTIGGLIGAAALYFVFTWLGLQETILSLVGLIGGALAGSYLLTGLGNRIEGLRSRSANSKAFRFRLVTRCGVPCGTAQQHVVPDPPWCGLHTRRDRCPQFKAGSSATTPSASRSSRRSRRGGGYGLAALLAAGGLVWIVEGAQGFRARLTAEEPDPGPIR